MTESEQLEERNSKTTEKAKGYIQNPQQSAAYKLEQQWFDGIDHSKNQQLDIYPYIKRQAFSKTTSNNNTIYPLRLQQEYYTTSQRTLKLSQILPSSSIELSIPAQKLLARIN